MYESRKWDWDGYAAQPASDDGIRTAVLQTRRKHSILAKQKENKPWIKKKKLVT